MTARRSATRLVARACSLLLEEATTSGIAWRVPPTGARHIASIAAGACLPTSARTAAWRAGTVPSAALRASLPGGVRVPVLRPPPRREEEDEEAGAGGPAGGLTPPPAWATAATPPTPARHSPPTTWAEAGWTAQATLTLPNALSAARLAAAPVLAHLISTASWPSAAALLAAAALSDWADGAAARALGQGSVLGTYLDPVADKAVVCAVAGSLAAAGALPAPLAALIIGRDAALVAGALAGRAAACGWAWPGGPEFFRLVPRVVEDESKADGTTITSPSLRSIVIPPAPAVRPLPLSKLNTALQFGVAGAAIGTAWGGWPGGAVVEGLAWAVGGATAGSGLQYAWAAVFGAAAKQRRRG